MAHIKKIYDKENKPYYRILTSHGYDIYGKQRRKFTTWNPPQGMTEKKADMEVMRQAVLIEEKSYRNNSFKSNISISEFSQIWLNEYCNQNVRTRTIVGYRKAINRCNEAVGHIRLRNLTEDHVYELIDFLQNKNANLITSNPLNENTVRCYFKTFKSMLNRAFKWGYIEKNPVWTCDTPKKHKSHIAFLDDPDIERFIERMSREDIPMKYGPMIVFVFFSGLRLGESIGLRWGDVSLPIIL